MNTILAIMSMSFITSVQPIQEHFCMAVNIYHEARNQPEHGMFGVGEVVMNRVDSDRFPDTVCGVVTDPNAFSWYEGEMSAPDIDNVIDNRSWVVANYVAYTVINEHDSQYTQGATHYHADYVSPFWKDHLTPVAVIGNHIFYVEN